MFAQCALVFSLAVCVEGVPRETLDRSVAAANAAASRFRGQARQLQSRRARRLQSRMLKALGPMMRKSVSQAPGRRLDSAQCAWTGSACEASADFISSLIPATGEFSQLWGSQQACMAHEGETACEAAGCTWDGGTTCSVSIGQDMMMSAMADVISTDDCGWIGSLIQPSPCLGYAASSGQCSAASGCAPSTAYEPQGGGTCAEVATCEAVESEQEESQADMMASLCPDGFNLEQSLQGCYMPLLLTLGENPSAEALAGLESQVMACALEACPSMLGIMTAMTTCAALTDQVACTQNSQCDWGGGGCNMSIVGAIMGSIPESCPLKTMMDSESGCQSLAQGQCTGNCEWQVSESCSGTAVVQESECGLKVLETMRAMARAGSTEAAAMVNGMLVEEHCGGLEVQELCETSAMVLETFSTNSHDRVTSSSPGLKGGMAVLLALVLGSALRTGAQSRHT